MVLFKELVCAGWIPYVTLSSLYFYFDYKHRSCSIFKTLYRKLIPIVVLNMGMLYPTWIYLVLKYKFIRINTTTTSQNSVGLWYQLLKALCVFDMIFYMNHRLLHKFSFLYRTIHSMHHKLVYPVAFGSLYSHPLEFIMCNLLPMTLAMRSFNKPSKQLLKLWIILGVCFVTITHSGHTDNKHLLHHRYLNCEFSAFGILDVIFSTTLKNPVAKALSHHHQYRQNKKSLLL